jgi:hypothetical protein
MAGMVAIFWNTAGRLARWIGDQLARGRVALYGLSGDFDARADNAGYWDKHRRMDEPAREKKLAARYARVHGGDVDPRDCDTVDCRRRGNRREDGNMIRSLLHILGVTAYCGMCKRTVEIDPSTLRCLRCGL